MTRDQVTEIRTAAAGGMSGYDGRGRSGSRDGESLPKNSPTRGVIQVSFARGTQQTSPVAGGRRLKRYVVGVPWTSPDASGARGGEYATVATAQANAIDRTRLLLGA